MRTRVGVAILAAGAARRFTRPKQLAPWRGTTLVRAITHEACMSSADYVAVVVGAHAFEIMPELEDYRAVVIPNPLWREGVASSVRAAALWATTARCDGLAIVLCDQARLTSAHLDALIAAHRLTHRSIASFYAGTIGAPAVFDKREFAALLELEGDTGAQSVLMSAKPAAVDWPDGSFDIDTPNDLVAETELRPTVR